MKKVLYGKGVVEVCEWLRNFCYWLETENVNEIRGASLLCVMDDVN